VVQLNLKKHHLPFRYIIGQVFLETLLPRIETVLLSKGVGRNVVHGPAYHDRTYNNLELLAGKNDTNVTVVEDGISIHFDLRKVYWCSKLANERQYLLRQFMLQRDDNVVLVDVFSGVGALCLLAAKQRHCIVHANDWNPHAIASLNDAVQRNHLHTNAIQTTCGDAYEYLVDIGLHWETLPHFVVMNYPLEAPTFLSALRWWRVNTKKTAKQHAVVIPTFYVYTFCHSGTAGSSPTTTSTSTMETAIDLIAHNLLPEGNVPTPNRKKHLNDLKCNVQAREIRQVMGAKAPGKVVVCVSFKATPQLLRHMQGDYI
jgi:tRNA (guanine37-N1)-methyltransferase